MRRHSNYNHALKLSVYERSRGASPGADPARPAANPAPNSMTIYDFELGKSDLTPHKMGFSFKMRRGLEQ